MGHPEPTAPYTRAASPFDLADEATYARWRAWKLAHVPRRFEDLVVEVDDPRALTAAERSALLGRIACCSVAVYRTRPRAADPAALRSLGAQLGLHRLDANWLADEDGLSRITVSGRSDERGGFIPYTDRPIRWHTDGYYHPEGRRIRGMILHCVQPAAEGGVNGLLDHELAYMALRDADPAHVQALMRPDAMTIPAREDDDGVARAAQAGPVFSLDEAGALHLRYTARTRSIVWRDDPATRAAVQALDGLLAGGHPHLLHGRLDAGMGLVGHNLLHERSGFRDDPTRPRLLLRARYLDRAALPGEAPWRTG